MFENIEKDAAKVTPQIQLILTHIARIMKMMMKILIAGSTEGGEAVLE